MLERQHSISKKIPARTASGPKHCPLTPAMDGIACARGRDHDLPLQQSINNSPRRALHLGRRISTSPRPGANAHVASPSPTALNQL